MGPNANLMWEDVLVRYEKLTSNAAPGIQDVQASSIMTKAQWHFLHTRISPLLNSKKEGLEETEVRMQGLSALITPVTISTFTPGSLQYGVYATLPLDFMYTLLEIVTIDKNDCIDGAPAQLSVNVLSHDEYIRGIINPFRKPYFDGHLGLVWRLTYGRNTTGYDSQTITTTAGYEYITGQTGKLHQLITNGEFNITDYQIVYLRMPRNIIVTYYSGGNMQNCELDDSTHPAIIDIAVDLLKEALTQPNQQIIPQMQQIE